MRRRAPPSNAPRRLQQAMREDEESAERWEDEGGQSGIEAPSRGGLPQSRTPRPTSGPLVVASRSTWWRTLTGAVERWEEVDGDQRAAALTYFILVSLVPLVIMLVTAGSQVLDREEATLRVVALVNQYAALTSEQERLTLATVRGLLEARGKISLVAFALLAWGALKFLSALIGTASRVWRSPPYCWWRLPLRSLGLLVITASAALVGVLLPGVALLVQQSLPSYLAIPEWAFILAFRLVPWLVLFFGLLMVYRLAPSRARTFADVWVAALAASILIGFGGRWFLVYAVDFARFNVLYGTLGGGVAFLLWTYLSSCVCVFGVCACAALAEVREQARPAELTVLR